MWGEGVPAAAAGALPLFRSKGKKSLDVKKQACEGGNPPGIPTAAPRGLFFGRHPQPLPSPLPQPLAPCGTPAPRLQRPAPDFLDFPPALFLLFFSFFSPSGFYLTHPVGRAPSRGRSRRLPSTPQYAHCLPAHARRAAPGPPFPVPGRTPGPKRAEKEGDTVWWEGGTSEPPRGRAKSATPRSRVGAARQRLSLIHI